MADSTKKVPQTKETEEGRDQDALLAESTQKTSQPKHVAEPLEPEASSDETITTPSLYIRDTMVSSPGEPKGTNAPSGVTNMFSQPICFNWWG